MRIINIRMLLCIFSVTVMSHAFQYPRLDEISSWKIASHYYSTINNSIFINGIDKKVETSSNIFQWKRVFGSIRLKGLMVNNVERPFVGYDYQNLDSTLTYIRVYGRYQVSGMSEKFEIYFYFYKDGKYLISCYLPSTTTYNVQIPIFFDYDLNGTSDDIGEFVWNENSSPAGFQPDITYGSLNFYPELASGNISYWSASPKEVRVNYPVMSSNTAPPVPTIEKTAICRIVDASSPKEQFGAIFWSENAGYSVVFKKWSSSILINPMADVNVNFQECQIATGGSSKPEHPRYAFRSSINQTVYVMIRKDLNASTIGNLSGKLFQRENGRPLKIVIHQHPLYPKGQTQSWLFDPDFIVKGSGSNSQSFRSAIRQLTGSDNISSIIVQQDLTVPSGYPSLSGGRPLALQNCIKKSDFLIYLNTVAPRDYSQANLENVREYKIDLYIVDWIVTLSGQMQNDFVYGWMDDTDGSNNKTARGRAWLSFPLMWGGEQAIDPPGDNKKQCVFVLLHEFSHTINLGHNISRYSTDPTGGIETVENIARWSDPPLILQFNDTYNVTLGLDFRVPRFFQMGPESWVKPGRYGTYWNQFFYNGNGGIYMFIPAYSDY